MLFPSDGLSWIGQLAFRSRRWTGVHDCDRVAESFGLIEVVGCEDDRHCGPRAERCDDVNCPDLVGHDVNSTNFRLADVGIVVVVNIAMVVDFPARSAQDGQMPALRRS
jgi:hypothetical protein